MAEAVVIGGFGSSPEQMNYVADRMSEYFDMETIGINFREASQQKKRLASYVADKLVVTHSGGIKPLVDVFESHSVRPDRLIAVAPPVPEQIRKLLWRGALIGLKLNDRIDSSLEQKVNVGSELQHHPFANFGRVPLLSSFDAVAEVAELQRSGIDTTIAFMQHDGLFDASTELVTKSVEQVRRLGGRVVELAGEHCRFSHDPVGTLQEIHEGSSERMQNMVAANSSGMPRAQAVYA